MGTSVGVRSSWTLAALGAVAMAHALGACGARTGLEIPEFTKTKKTCEDFSALASLAKLDVFLLIDSSGSMEEETSLGVTKWEAVKSALTEFLSDPKTDGSDVGLTFLPQINPDVPSFCHVDEQCDEPGACMPLGLCLPSETSICQADGQCLVAGDRCERLGLCEGGSGVFCQLDIDACGALGACREAGFCENRTSCSPHAYRIIGLAQLPDELEGLMYALDTRVLDGFTPTLPALTGVVRSATEHQAENPRNKVVIILATDGLPTACDPDLPNGGVAAAVENLAAVATEARDTAVQTFVIGVFSPDEAGFAMANLDAIAQAGGTDDAFIITTDSEVSDLFLTALEEVRRSNICEFSLSDEAREVDLTQLRVQLTTQTGTSKWVDWVGEQQDCGDGHGFYFDRDPNGEVAPGRVILCPTSCASEPESILVSCRNLVQPLPPEP